MKVSLTLWELVLLLSFSASRPVGAALADEAKARAALTVLRAECFSCHGEVKQKGGLSLASHEAVLRGGDDGLVVKPGQPDESILISYLAVGADPHMPPKKQLEPEQIRAIREWVEVGLPWDQAILEGEDPLRPVELEPLPRSFQPVLAIAISPDAQRLAVGRGAQLALYDLTQTNVTLLLGVPAHGGLIPTSDFRLPTSSRPPGTFSPSSAVAAEREKEAVPGEAVQSLAWSHDGQRLASGGFRRVRIWKVASLELEREVTNGLSGRVTALEFAPDDLTLVLADGGNGADGYLRVLEFSATPPEGGISSWRAHADTIYDLEFSRDGSQLLSAGGDQLVKVWEVATRKEVATLEGHTAQVLAAAFNTNATQVVSGGADRQLKVWDIATREKIISLGNHAAGLTSVAWPGEGSTIFAVTDAGGLYRYTNLKSHTGEQSSASGDERRLGEMPEAVLCVTSSADGKRIAAGDYDGRVRVWNEEGKLLADLAPTEPPEAEEVTLVPPMYHQPQVTSDRAAESRARPQPVPVDRPATEIVTLQSEPSELVLSADSPRHGIVITARTVDGFEIDVTEAVNFRASRGAPFHLSDSGEVVAQNAGTGVLIAQYGQREIAVPVTVRGQGELTPVRPSFVRDVLPALNQAGCSSGGCHAKPDGQNGFKLSVFSYDPKTDYAEIVKEARGRRVFPAAPEESLVLLKPLAVVPHEGGQRFARGSETHMLLTRWLRAGMPYTLTNEPVVQSITVFPKERRYRKGARQRLLVQAHYSDGSVRDVTRLAAYNSNDKEMAKVDENGRVTIGQLTGQGVVVARYMGLVGDTQIMVPAELLLPAERYAALPTNNFIDTLADSQFQRLGLFPSELCSDAEFLRRAKLDAVGLLPNPDEVRAFLADSRPDKRERFIAQVLEDPAYADYWANKWADLLRPNPDRVGVKSVFLLDQWLREQFRANRPYDQFVREILLAEGSNHRAGAAVIYRDRREPAELTTMFSQLFLGTRLECAKCHHHPNEKWSQDDFYQFAAFFGPLKQKGAGLSPPISAGTETFYFAPGGTVKHPVSGVVMKPRPPGGPEVPSEAGDPRRELADWLTRPDNPFFAQAAVNRVWANFFGRGLVHPIDDFRSSNPCVNPALLKALAADFSDHGFDLKHLMRTILESRTYQLSTMPNESNLADTRNFSRGYRRRLLAETMVDAVRDATGVPDTFAAVPVGGRATQAWSYKIESHFLDAFGRPNSSSDCPCERDTQLSVVQSLHLMNSRSLQEKLSDPKGRIRKLARSSRTPAEVISELYLSTLNRWPTESELTTAAAAFTASGATRETATEDVFWALLNSPEFVFNH